MTHTEYTAHFRNLATRHQDVQHTASASHFARINLTSDPMFPMQAQIDEFMNGLRENLHSPFILLASYDTDYRDQEGDNIDRYLHGRMIVLEDIPKKGFEEEEAAYQRTQEIGLDLLAETARVLSDDPRRGMLDWDSVGSEKMRISTRRNLAGTGYSFSILQTYVNIHRSSKFNPA
jgi:hypothetical protein